MKEKWMIGIMVTATVVKVGLMTYCRRFKNEIVRAYAQDHFFDVITNSIGLATAVLAIKFYWWLDPLGAILVCPSVHIAHSTFFTIRKTKLNQVHHILATVLVKVI